MKIRQKFNGTGALGVLLLVASPVVAVLMPEANPILVIAVVAAFAAFGLAMVIVGRDYISDD